MVSDASLSPELIEARSFTAGFRGYDQGEVRSYLKRLAAEVRDLRDRAQQLESAWHSAEERAARPPVLDEDTLMAAVGEETASILRSARAAAADLRKRAAEEAEKVVAEAQARADQIEQDAKQVLARETTAAEEAANRIVAGGRGEVAELLDKAQREADAIRAQAEQDRALTIEGATATRDRILEDLARRRRVATVQIEQLRAGRERLIESYAVVRRTLEEAQHELSRADAEARAAADEVGRRMRSEDPAPGGVVESPVVAVESPVQAEPVQSEPVGPESPASADGEPVGPESPAPTDVQATVESPVVVAEAPDAPSAREPAPAKRGGRRLAHFGRKNGSSAATVPEPVPPAASSESEAASAEAGTGSGVEELFAKLRSAQDTAAEEEAQEASSENSVSDGDEVLLQMRESVLVDLEVTLTRKLKRALQDEQNDVLDRLRGVRGEVTAERVLPDQSAQAARYVEAARPLAEQAAAAGARFAAETLGRKRSTTEHPSVDDLVDEAANNVVEPLRRRLDQAISRRADEDQGVLVESLGSAYREWKSQQLERVAGDLLAAAFARGTWQATPPGTTMRWIVEDVDGPCPDCDDDALAGSLPKEEPFPTGQHHPPAHTGCRCLLVPSAS